MTQTQISHPEGLPACAAGHRSCHIYDLRGLSAGGGRPVECRCRATSKHVDPIVTVHKDTVSDWFAKDAAKAGIGDHLHRLRHTFCAHMVIAGVPLRRVQILAGHADYATTEKYYADLTPEDDGAVGKLKH
ncbi:tyrosine-type recombinase/integrase [Stenotrophomonas sp. LGBM10]|uniref:tyrosine-type recombinase/integrase n=1 Tax=Stenotrophomonas sp. LGBM10 TaxID=3390038 RepID=UPI00398BA3C9